MALPDAERTIAALADRMRRAVAFDAKFVGIYLGGAWVAGGLRLQILGFRMHHNRAADRRFRVVREGNLMVHVIQLRIARRIRFDIAHIAFMPRTCIRAGMRLVGGIKMRACRTGIGCAAIAKFMDMKAVFARR